MNYPRYKIKLLNGNEKEGARRNILFSKILSLVILFAEVKYLLLCSTICYVLNSLCPEVFFFSVICMQVEN